MKTILTTIGALAAATAVQAQHLSAEQIEQYRAGAGLGYAKAAEH